MEPHWWPLANHDLWVGGLGMMTRINTNKPRPVQEESAAITVVMIWRFVHPILTGVAIAAIAGLAAYLNTLDRTIVKLEEHDKQLDKDIAALSTIMGTRVGANEVRIDVHRKALDALQEQLNDHIADDRNRKRRD